MTTLPPVLTEEEVADLLRVSLSKLRRARRDGKPVPAYFLLGQAVRYRRTDVDAFLAEQTAAAR